ncbi:PREDICTED: uncharacterized protein C7orf62 homolog isoform X3 [Priapulus caudatus]|uniref:Uncharacterized protein C7orf62 homolog isoform X3 n=1 Tax=Priapulus caudatus TaxID=37621 RepID=A0ABM1EFV6_PRICU|nr:PREDICTED: uncharacterized protein C7orf62 homolog isoform X3 [Priapulus caudatus]
MAAVVNDVLEDSVYDAQRTTLLDVIEERNRSLSKKSMLHRLVYLAKFRSPKTGRDELGPYYEKQLRAAHASNGLQGEHITGLLLIYQNHVVHIMEGSSEMLMQMIRGLDGQTSNMTGLFIETKVHRKAVLDSLQEKVPELLLQQDVIVYLLQSKELCTPSQYLEAYDSPLNVVLDADLTWPIATRLYPYN